MARGDGAVVPTDNANANDSGNREIADAEKRKDGSPAKIQTVAAKLRSRGRSHWVIAALVLAIGMLFTDYADEHLQLDVARNALSQKLLEWYWRPPVPGDVKVVLIRDEDYWQPDLAGRVPIRRDFLAHVVKALDDANASVIGLDFDMRLPHPSKLWDFPEYHEESLTLARAVVAAAEHHKIVLSKTVRREISGGYQLEPDLYQLYGICTQLNPKGQWSDPGTAELSISKRAASNISCGYIRLNLDKRELPTQVTLTNGAQLDSFSLSVARAHNPGRVADVSSSLLYASYIRPEKLDPPDKRDDTRVVYSAHEVLYGSLDSIAAINAQTVIVGSDWNTRAEGRGPKTDLHDTPVGSMGGAIVHLNFAEAFLDRRTYHHVPHAATIVLEIGLSGGAAIWFALLAGPGQKILALVGGTVLLIGVEWVTLNLFGFFLEVFVPFVGLWIHSLFEGFATAGTPGH
jgi:CHASE2 domain-containing sensor protein